MAVAISEGFKLGEVVLTSKPFVHLLNCQFRGSNCNRCFERELFGRTKLSACTQCKYFYYCSKSCQREDWPIHKHECKKLKRLPKVETVNDVLMLSRVLIKLQECDGYEESETVGQYTRKFDDLVSHEEHIKNSKDLMKETFERYDVVQQYLGVNKVPPFFTVLEIMGKVMINAITVIDHETFTCIGRALYLGATLLDHSCDADAEYSFKGPNVYVRAVRDLPHRDVKQVRVPYIDRMQPAEVRQEILYNRYFFKCNCSRCSDPSSDAFLTEVLNERDAPWVEQMSKEILNRISALELSGNPKYILEHALCALKAQRGVLGENHVLRVKLKAKVVDLYTTLGLWKEASDLGEQILEPTRLAYGPYSNQIASHLVNVAYTQMHAGDLKEAKKNVNEAKKVMAVTYGTDHKSYKEADQLHTLILALNSKK